MSRMMRMKLVALLALAMVAGATRAATEVVDGMTYTYFITSPDAFHPEITSKFATITKAEGDNKSVSIPSTLGGATVRTLYGGVFLNNTTVMKITIPETVTALAYFYDNSIGGAVAPFRGCLALTSCTIPSGVTEIPPYCFYGCSKLRAVTLPSGLKTINSDAFWRCSSLGAIDLPNGLTSIGYNAFRSCSNLTSVWMPDTVTSLEGSCFEDCSSLVTARLSSGLTSVPACAFAFCTALRDVTIPDNVTSVGNYAFQGCSSLKEITLPVSITSVGSDSFSSVGRVVFQGKPPAGLTEALISTVVYPKEYGAQWQSFFPLANTGGYVNPNKPVVTIVSSGVRANAPTILDVVYKVTSKKTTVKVRALAFEDGVRSFAKVTRPETFVADVNGVATDSNVGDAVAANVEHTLSWQVSSDFKTDLAKMKFEVLAVEDDILPLEFITIPANGNNKAMELSWNLITESQVYDALLWLYANKDNDLTLTNGDLKNGSEYLARGASLWNNYTVNGYGCAATPFVFSKMGYNTLTGVPLSYANEMTRMGLSPNGSRQYAYKWID